MKRLITNFIHFGFCVSPKSNWAYPDNLYTIPFSYVLLYSKGWSGFQIKCFKYSFSLVQSSPSDQLQEYTKELILKEQR